MNNESGAEFLTTSGALIQDSSGKSYMTAASHGFPSRDQVFHLRANERPIGSIVKTIDYTDIALVQLDDTETFMNETFESLADDIPATKPQGFLPLTELFVGKAYSITRIP